MPRRNATTALLVIDMFSRFDFPDAGALAPLAERAATRIRRVRDHCDARRWPVIHANDNFSDWQRDFRQQVEQCRRDGGSAARIADMLAPAPHHYFVLKPKHSAFLATPLPILLAKLGVRRLWLTGMATDSCVLATALDANAREFEVTVVADATAALPARRRVALQTLERSGAARIETVAGLLSSPRRAQR
ncbi:cysteine hydrolase family protein [Stenotrophomonas maltophilia]|uniref:cysteine hydrolase family protein n=1 Tax=Stenotrophomonas maltophilia TaxID=40324 RepID=UPI0006AC6335|nr:isochorismatase family cysteine hydrolase [Stenotrophomonas maltophilia]KOQ70291.1 isochorismatase [Stenotrophomonas maltophilia]